MWAVALEDPAAVAEVPRDLAVITAVPPRLHFDDLGHALITAFQVMVCGCVGEGGLVG